MHDEEEPRGRDLHARPHGVREEGAGRGHGDGADAPHGARPIDRSVRTFEKRVGELQRGDDRKSEETADRVQQQEVRITNLSQGARQMGWSKALADMVRDQEAKLRAATTLPAGASLTMKYSTDSSSFSAASDVVASDPVCQ
jgi:hypothetical protein